MAKRNSPALYELIRHHSGERVPQAHTHEPEPGRSVPMLPSASWLQPGRVIQVPVGYLFVAIAGVLILVILFYTIAYHRGVQAERMAFEAEYGPVTTTERAGPVLDPLTRQNAATGVTSEARRDSQLRAPAQADAARAWGPIASDPRQRGMAYFILAETTESGATRLAEFCRERGLEAYVVSGHNVRLRRVIALPGIPPDRVTGEQARSLRQQIHDVGRDWTQAGLGRWNYHEAYLSEYR
jgi:hypothetical protein